MILRAKSEVDTVFSLFAAPLTRGGMADDGKEPRCHGKEPRCHSAVSAL